MGLTQPLNVLWSIADTPLQGRPKSGTFGERAAALLTERDRSVHANGALFVEEESAVGGRSGLQGEPGETLLSLVTAH